METLVLIAKIILALVLYAVYYRWYEYKTIYEYLTIPGLIRDGMVSLIAELFMLSAIFIIFRLIDEKVYGDQYHTRKQASSFVREIFKKMKAFLSK